MMQEEAREDGQMNAYLCDLNGKHMVSAGAGTGKTYTIQILYLRMVLLGIPIEKILVVTFTELATAELQGRLRTVLETMQVFLSQAKGVVSEYETKEQYCQAMIEKLQGNAYGQIRSFFTKKAIAEKEYLDLGDFYEKTAHSQVANALSYLNNALLVFDMAPVSTIHGFCSRMLNENAFESGLRYGMEVRKDTGALIKSILSQFYRRFTSDEKAGARRLDLLQKCKITPESLKTSLKTVIGNPHSYVNWGERLQNLTYEELHEKCIELENDKSVFSRGITLYKLTVCRLAWEYAQVEMAGLKSRDGFMTYDDMLYSLDNALPSNSEDSSEKREFLKLIQKQFSCIIVDEFQDTDSCQSSIFMKIFNEAFQSVDGDALRSFFMLGDPKQAIYMFRGGDVQTFQAAAKIVKKHELEVNFRASDAYIDAMNDYFQDREQYGEGIEFREIKKPSDMGDVNPHEMMLDAREQIPLLSWSASDDALTAIAEEIKALVEGGRVSIKQKVKDGFQVAQYSDFAVLTTSNETGRTIQAVLQSHGVPAVLMGDISIFKQDEARLMLSLLDAVIEPGNQPKLLLLLGSELFNFDAETLEKLRMGRGLSDIQLYFKKLHETWEKMSFLNMFNSFLNKPLSWDDQDEQLSELNVVRLVRKSKKRAGTLAVLRQLAELLHQVSQKQHLGMNGIREYLENHLLGQGMSYAENDNSTVEEDDDDDPLFSMRVPSASSSVKVMTIHKSKGLEFPIVYVPNFKAAVRAASIYHEGNRRIVRMIDEKSSQKKGKGKSEGVKLTVNDKCKEEAAHERYRLLYVAITRAQYMCRFLTSKGTNGEAVNDYSLPETVINVQNLLGAEDGQPDGGKASQGQVRQPEGDNEARRRETLACGKLERKPGWFQASFSMLSKVAQNKEGELEDDVQAADEAPAVQAGMVDDEGVTDEEENDKNLLSDEMAWQMKPYEEREVIFQFPGGTRTGTCWHEVFENWDFSKSVDVEWQAVEERLDHYAQLGHRDAAQRQARIAAFQSMLEKIQSYPLKSDGGTVVKLFDVPPESCLHEFNFTYQLNVDVPNEKLVKVFKEHSVVFPKGWSHKIRAGWALNGSIDLLFQHPTTKKFYIIDWKTNLLGADSANFTDEGLKQEMNAHFYELQYLIYTVAFIQYYRSLHPQWTFDQKSYQDLFGGCFYLFVRGLGTDKASKTVYADTPSFELIKDLAELIGVRND